MKEEGSKRSDERQGGGLVWATDTLLTAGARDSCARGWRISERLPREALHLTVEIKDPT